MQFGFMDVSGTVDAVFFLRTTEDENVQEDYRAKRRKMYICFVDLEKAFDRQRGKCWNGQ